MKPSNLPVEIVKVANKKLKTSLVEAIDRKKKIFEFLEYVTMVSEEMVLECYITLIYEITNFREFSNQLIFVICMKRAMEKCTKLLF